jgi:hypothetical protein
MNETVTFDAALARYEAHITGLIDAYWTRNGFTHAKPTIVHTDGPRYVRVAKKDGLHDGLSVHSFVDKTTGDIYKGTWKAPVKNGKRGNIYTDYVGRVNEHGCCYLR